MILGLDAQQLRLGYALCHLEDGEPVRCGCIPLAAGAGFSRSVREALLAISAPLAFDQTCELALVAIEDAHLGPNRMGSLRHAMAIGEVRQAVDRRWPDAAVQLIAPQEWKKLVGLRGNASKDAVMVQAHELGWMAEEQDEADAACIAYAAWWRNEHDFRQEMHGN